MSRCLSGGSWTPLQQYANSLPAMEEARQWPTILPCVKQGLRGCGSLYLCSLHGDRLGLGVLDEGMGEGRRCEQEGTVGKRVASASIISRWRSVGWHFVSCKAFHACLLQVPMHFPMYAVTAERLLQMTKVCPHEELKARSRSSL